MKIKEIAFVVYAVNDIPAARDFYEKTLGLKQLNFWGNDEGGMIEYVMGDKDEYTFAIGKGAPLFTPGTKTASGGVVAFEVDDLDGAIKALKDSKRTFLLDSHESPACTMAVVLDPSGNTVVIHKRKTDAEKAAAAAAAKK